jgi:hypothetical protein
MEKNVERRVIIPFSKLGTVRMVEERSIGRIQKLERRRSSAG